MPAAGAGGDCDGLAAEGCLRAAAARGWVFSGLTSPPCAGSLLSSMFPPVPAAGSGVLTNPMIRGTETRTRRRVPARRYSSGLFCFVSAVFFFFGCGRTTIQTGLSDMQNRIGEPGFGFCGCLFGFWVRSRATAGAPRPCTRAQGTSPLRIPIAAAFLWERTALGGSSDWRRVVFYSTKSIIFRTSM